MSNGSGEKVDFDGFAIFSNGGQIRVEGFVLKNLLTYFEMLIVPHALQCVDGCFFVFYRI